MTLIECFDRSVIANIAGCLYWKPEKLIFLGDEQQMRQPVERYRSFLRGRGLNTSVSMCHVAMNHPAQLVKTLMDLVTKESRCIVDVTGGDDRILVAMGAVLSQLSDEQRKLVSIQQFGFATGKLVPYTNGEAFPHGSMPSLTVRELIALHGGTIHPSSDQPSERCAPADLNRLWQLVRADSKEWNRKMSLLGEFESRSESKTQVFLSRSYLRSSIKKYEEKEAQVEELLQQFSRHGIIHDSSNAHALRYSYASPLLRYCTLKAGNVLETKVLLEARALQQDGKPYFDDCQMSVHIDWDGVVNTSENWVPETRNEMDLILTKGLTPLFISCKNGDIGDEELYKLYTVATLFGGAHGRKMLIATDLDRKSTAANRSFMQRAQDMGIYLVTDAASLSASDWQRIFLEAMA